VPHFDVFVVKNVYICKMENVFETHISELLTSKIPPIEDYFKADFLFYYGVINEPAPDILKRKINKLQENQSNNKLCIMLNTQGGSAETVEIMVKIIRHHYENVIFIVPKQAYSAGTIFCMSGDKIFMDYSSSLGPIDPQVNKGSGWVQALGYLDKFEEMVDKSKKQTLSPAEFAILKEQDIGLLRRYEQARDLTISLLTEWLVKYKFKCWTQHTSTGLPVTNEEKKDRAKAIAEDLGDHKKWHSHARSLNIEKLREMKLFIDDYSDNQALSSIIGDYHDSVCSYLQKNNKHVYNSIFIHSKLGF
jgi:hypothetical protein